MHSIVQDIVLLNSSLRNECSRSDCDSYFSCLAYLLVSIARESK
jgi:hypothetical protein